jgi:hypothetical protein
MGLYFLDDSPKLIKQIILRGILFLILKGIRRERLTRGTPSENAYSLSRVLPQDLICLQLRYILKKELCPRIPFIGIGTCLIKVISRDDI